MCDSEQKRQLQQHQLQEQKQQQSSVKPETLAVTLHAQLQQSPEGIFNIMCICVCVCG